MANPVGELELGVLRLDFDRRLTLQFRGSAVTSDAGLLVYRELDDALGLTARAGEMVADARTGKNGRHALAGLLRQSVFGRLAGYEDVNDAERLRHDPAMRWVVGGKAAQGCAASPSQMGRFETRWLATEVNLSALTDLSGHWIDLVHNQRPPRGIVLDMDLSVSPTHGEQEMSIWNGHYQSTCYHPLFVFNQFGDLERCALRPGNVQAPTAGRACSSRSSYGIAAGSGASISGPMPHSPCQASTSTWRLSTSNTRSVCPPTRSFRKGSAICSSAQTDGRRTRSGATTRIHLPGGKLDEAGPSDRQGRVASGRTVSARRLHRDEHEPPGRARRCLLQQTRDVRAVDQGRQRRDQVDAVVMPNVRRPTRCGSSFMRSPTTSAISCGLWRRRSRSRTGH